nr:hypothetical protein [Candidatus Sigynarchaeum springense]
MVQINIRNDKTLDAIISLLAEERKVSKSIIARDMLTSFEVIERLSKALDDAPLTPENDAYTGKITERILKSLDS